MMRGYRVSSILNNVSRHANFRAQNSEYSFLQKLQYRLKTIRNGSIDLRQSLCVHHGSTVF